MVDSALLTAEQFAETRFDLPDSGRWTELVRGRIATLAPPEPEHGTVVLNLSKELASYLQRDRVGYACFELGLILARSPDTVRYPPMSLFLGSTDFSETDKEITDKRPALVVEIASSPVRRRTIGDRVQEFLGWGIRQAWVIDPLEKTVDVLAIRKARQHLTSTESLEGGDLLPGFGMNVGDLFAEPSWWK